MGLKIFESYKDNKHNNSKHNNNTNNSNNNNNTNNSIPLNVMLKQIKI